MPCIVSVMKTRHLFFPQLKVYQRTLIAPQRWAPLHWAFCCWATKVGLWWDESSFAKLEETRWAKIFFTLQRIYWRMLPSQAAGGVNNLALFPPAPCACLLSASVELQSSSPHWTNIFERKRIHSVAGFSFHLMNTGDRLKTHPSVTQLDLLPHLPRNTLQHVTTFCPASWNCLPT